MIETGIVLILSFIYNQGLKRIGVQQLNACEIIALDFTIAQYSCCYFHNQQFKCQALVIQHRLPALQESFLSFLNHSSKVPNYTAVNTHFIKPLANVIFNVIIGQQLASSKLSFSVQKISLSVGQLSRLVVSMYLL